jgi:hypothetical protein
MAAIKQNRVKTYFTVFDARAFLRDYLRNHCRRHPWCQGVRVDSVWGEKLTLQTTDEKACKDWIRLHDGEWIGFRLGYTVEGKS